VASKKLKKSKEKTKARINLRHWLTHKLRRLSYQWSPRKEAIKKARVDRGKYRCAICQGEMFGPKDIQLDHIQPVIDPHNGFENWDTYINRLFCEEDGFQVCCKTCHKYKSMMENQIRLQTKDHTAEDEDL